MHNKVNIKSFEKNPQKGGTPAIENKAIIKVMLKKFVVPIFEKEWSVFVSELINWNNVEKIKYKEILYINI